MKEFFLINEPIAFGDICKIYAPLVREVVASNDYSIAQQILTVQQEDIDLSLTDNWEEELPEEVPTPFMLLFEAARSSEDTYKQCKSAIEFFIHEPVEFDFANNSILINIDLQKEFDSDEEVQAYLKSARSLKESQYPKFQNAIRAACGMDEIPPFQYQMHVRARRMQGKARYRDTIKAKEQKNSIGLASVISSVCLMNTGLNPLNIGQISYPALMDIFNRYQAKQSYENDMRLLTTPFVDTKDIKPKNWLEN